MSHRRLLLLLALITPLLGAAVFSCVAYRESNLAKEDLQYTKDIIESVVLIDGNEVIFDEHVGGKYQVVQDSSGASGSQAHKTREVVTGKDRYGRTRSVDFDQILYARVSHIDAGMTTLRSVGGIALAVVVVGAVVVATKESCPFVYSYDGTTYRFDAEPLGGATTEGLSRTDYSKLEYLRPDSGCYRLLVRNEVDETQFIDRMTLCVVDHEPGMIPIATGTEDQFRCVRAPLPPSRAEDESGASLIAFVSSSDGVAWQSQMEQLSAHSLIDTRHTLTFTFPKPRDAKRAQLVIHAGTTLWGSHMIRLMYELRGNSVDEWFRQADRKGPALYRVLNFLEREELFSLRLSVQKNNEWVQRGSIIGGGPFLYETQTLPISVAGIHGDSLTIRVRPPVGFWSIDYLGVEYDTDVEAQGIELPIHRAMDEAGHDIAELLSHTDSRYYEMPTTSHSARLEFTVPPQKPGTDRSVFLKTSGYYKLHLAKDRPADLQTLSHLFAQPGAVVEFSMKKYAEWYTPLRMAMRAHHQ
ncbi:MAG TPA: hypothetical protein VK470_08135 [Bacteroidota bacterium]|nr:hypothetical protein [Bacteroidota bacterium]